MLGGFGELTICSDSARRSSAGHRDPGQPRANLWGPNFGGDSTRRDGCLKKVVVVPSASTTLSGLEVPAFSQKQILSGLYGDQKRAKQQRSTDLCVGTPSHSRQPIAPPEKNQRLDPPGVLAHSQPFNQPANFRNGVLLGTQLAKNGIPRDKTASWRSPQPCGFADTLHLRGLGPNRNLDNPAPAAPGGAESHVEMDASHCRPLVFPQAWKRNYGTHCQMSG